MTETDRPWFETFFDEQYLNLYGPMLPEERTRQEVEFVATTLGLPEEHRWFKVRMYLLPELAAMLEGAGLAVERVFGGSQGEPYGLDSRRLIVLARRGDASP